MEYNLAKILSEDKSGFKIQRIDGSHLHIVVGDDRVENHVNQCNIISKSVEKGKISIKALSTSEKEILAGFDFEFRPLKREKKRISWILKQKLEKDAEIYGMGDKAVIPDLRGRRCIIWGTDTYSYGYGAEPLYKNIPFYIKTTFNSQIGVFINNSFRLEFDFGYSDDNIQISGAGGNIDMYLIYGNSPLEIVSQYTMLTGTPQMPPLWALGFHQSKWSYVPENVLMKVAAKFRSLKIPCDSLYLDIDYMNGYRVFTWNKRKFPDPKAMLKELNQLGFHMVAIIDPGIKIDKRYSIYKQGIAGNYFLTNPNETITTGPVWPGYCHFPDFTNTEVRSWWASHVTRLMQYGLNGIWNDMNEPALFNKADMIQTQRTLDDDVRMSFEGKGGNFAEGHNLYGMLMSEATMEGVRQANDKRPFVLTRSTYAGGQKFAAVWTGDNVATWEHLRIANYQCQNLAMSGFSFAGSDIGGFVGNPDGELFCRWLQLALFHPFFRNHSSKDFAEQEPWSFGEKWTNHARMIIQWRYRLLGYIYTVFRKYVLTGEPMIRPKKLVHNNLKNTWDYNQFYLGEALLAIPVMEPGQSGGRIDLPDGFYYDINTGKQYEGNHEYFIRVNMDAAPALLKGGHVLPIWPVMQYVNEKPLNEIDLWCGFSKKETVVSTLYLDEFDGHSYLTANFREITFEYRYRQTYVLIKISQSGSYTPPIREFKFKFPGFDSSLQSIECDGRLMKADTNNQTITVRELPEYIKLNIKN